ncbi:alpha-L-rhamnosidase C-terminal domain-containing protein [Streptomyces sp. NPDC092295]|uniref:alpha-L-rhamnosidase C-terminal domain-containing protein n=1 Tax=Streptomyces sp. NPDC092295 TaxID=3366011 RepID=UPI0037F15D3B
MSGFKVATQRAYPSWGHWFENGADTMWEYWRVPRNRSHNHYVKGTVVQWLYENGAGPRPGSDGYRTFTVQPDARVGVSWARTSPRTVRGEVSVAWAAAGGVFRLRVKVPVGSTAEVHVPAPDRAEVTAHGEARKIRRATTRSWDGPCPSAAAGPDRSQVQRSRLPVELRARNSVRYVCPAMAPMRCSRP